MKVFINGVLTSRFRLMKSTEKDKQDFVGSIEAQFPNGDQLKANIIRELLPQILAPSQHLYDTDKGNVAVEYFE